MDRYDADPGYGSGNSFVNYHEWQGTRDLAAFLSVPAAIQFMQENQWDQVRQDCHKLAASTRRKIHELTGLTPLCPESPDWFSQMFAAPLPEVDVKHLQTRLYDEYRIEVPLHRWNELPLIRVSIQGYNAQTDVDSLVDALETLLPD